MQNYKPKEQTEEKKVSKVISGTAKTKKKSEVRKLADVFLPDDIPNVRSYIFTDIIVPTIKKVISDSVDMVLYGEPGKSRKSSGGSKVSYGRYYETGGRSSNNARRPVAGYNYDDIALDNRAEAEEVLNQMDELIDTYGFASVADLYDLVGITGNYTDNKYGWTDIRNAGVVRTTDGYLLKFPKALPLK